MSLFYHDVSVPEWERRAENRRKSLIDTYIEQYGGFDVSIGREGWCQFRCQQLNDVVMLFRQ